jgi:hypothetical protein
MTNSDKFWRFQNLYYSLFQDLWILHSPKYSVFRIAFFTVIEYNIIYLKNIYSHFFKTMKCLDFLKKWLHVAGATKCHTPSVPVRSTRAAWYRRVHVGIVRRWLNRSRGRVYKLIHGSREKRTVAFSYHRIFSRGYRRAHVATSDSCVHFLWRCRCSALLCSSRRTS